MGTKKEILKRFISDQFSFNDYLSVSSFFKENDPNKEWMKSMKEDWNKTSGLGSEQEKLDRILDKLHHQINLNKEYKASTLRKLYLNFSRTAAVLLIPAIIIIATLTYLSIDHSSKAETWAEIYAPAGSRTKFQLPDGSKGWLNSGSSIKYPVNFMKNRRVEISGEAWFDVVHVDKSDFKVMTPFFDVRVLGTQFNVLAYPYDQTAEVVLEKGKIQILGKDNIVRGELAPDQQCIYDKKQNRIIKKAIDSKAYTSWKDGLLIFKNSNITEIVRRLERKYNTEILLLGDSLETTVFRATFQDETLDEICKLLSTVAPIGYKVLKRERLPDGSFSKSKVEMWLINQ